MTSELPSPSRHLDPRRGQGAGQRAALEAAYRAACYHVWVRDGHLVIRIGLPHPDVDAVLDRHGSRTWAYVTAYNPASVLLDPEENQRRQRELETDLTRRGRHYYRGQGLGTHGDWPAEQSVLILDLGRDEALELAEKYGQAALVFGELGQAAELLWTNSYLARGTP